MDDNYYYRESNYGLINSKLENNIEVPDEMAEEIFTYVPAPSFSQEQNVITKQGSILKQVVVPHNIIEDQILVSEIFGQGMKKRDSFSFTYEYYRDFPSLNNLSHLPRELSLQLNYITSLDSYQSRESMKFIGMHLVKLDLSDNLIQSIPQCFSTFMVSLEHLDISHNLLTNIHVLVQTKLKSLYCQRNPIDILPVDLYEMIYLQELKFDWPSLIWPDVESALDPNNSHLKNKKKSMDILKLKARCKDGRYNYTLDAFLEDFKPKTQIKEPDSRRLKEYIKEQNTLCLSILIRNDNQLIEESKLWERNQGLLELVLEFDNNRAAMLVLSCLPDKYSIMI